MPTTVLHTVSFLHSLFIQPETYLVIGNDSRPGALCNRDAVTYMVAMAMRNENEVGCHFVSRNRRLWVSGQKWINEDAMPTALDERASMAEPLNARWHKQSLLCS